MSYNFISRYKHTEIENKCINIWYNTCNDVYKWKNEPRENTYVIDTPPPTVSGTLHMGHIYSYTHTDVIARFQRMIGKNVYYSIGFDDNGLPTERLVEKKKKIKPNNTNRAEFIEKCYEVIELEEEKFEDLFKRLGLSVDWNLKYQTISPNSQKISQLSFLDLLEKQEVYYSKNAPVFWDIIDKTAIAQAEIEDIEKESLMHYINFGNNLTVATTRPELLPACVAILYNPDDERYTYLKNQYHSIPLFKIQVPFIEDISVKIDKGTGLVMCCTFGDTLDLVWWKKYQLPLHIIISHEGKIINNDKIFDNCHDIPSAKKIFNNLIDLNIKNARQKIVEILQDNNLIIKTEQIIQTVKCAERSKSPIEILPTPQWFIKTLKYKEELLQCSKKIKWYPEHMQKKLEVWIENLSQDWCISRNRFFGVPIPIWYSKRLGEEGRILYPEPEQLPINPLKDLPKGYNKNEVDPEINVMDTWATSSLTPQLNSLAINEKYHIDYQHHQKIFPCDLRPQSHEIIRTWTFSTIVKSFLHEKKLPWKNIMISGWCLAKDKSKMSKSKGNIIDPINILDEFGTDAVRYWACNVGLGNDCIYSKEFVIKGKKIINKLFNAAKFSHIQIDNFIKTCDIKNILSQYIQSQNDINIFSDKIICSIDKWMINQISTLIKTIKHHLSNYQYSSALKILEHFFIEVFCDNYLEIIKTRVYSDNIDLFIYRQSGILSLFHSMNTMLKLFASFVPFITEYLYQTNYSIFLNKIHSIHSRSSWPLDTFMYNDNINYKYLGNSILQIIKMIRIYKTEKSLSMKIRITKIEIIFLQNINFTEDLKIDLMNVINCDDITVVTSFAKKYYESNSELIRLNIRN